ncbi:uncharacterized protein LOC131876993 [Tigriopus californicus]|uniref:uncharacterized protein LOC131876993 n=1 Tax=Tigriopus californicus TaxID=6832 RepID=UPI0027D9F7AB|nr:uncharacterized protein LOC131876993 [Tigriopus californicus]
MAAAHKKMTANSKKSVTLEGFKRAKIIAGLSGNVALKFVRQIRGSVKVEPGFKEALANVNRKFSSLFAVEEEVSPLDSSKMYIVFFRRPMEFFDSILSERGSTAIDFLLRLSIDEGRGFLKISGNLVFRHAHLETSSGVKRTFLLAVSPIKEAYQHIKIMLAKLDLDVGEDLDEFYSQDLKCFNIICGLGNHASTRPCIYCLWVNGCKSEILYEERTLGGLRSDYQQFFSTPKAKDFNSTQREPILLPHKDPTILLLQVCALPWLHIRLGIVNHVYSKMKREIPQTVMWSSTMDPDLRETNAKRCLRIWTVCRGS